MPKSWKLEQGVWGGNFSFSKDARLAKTGKKILLYKLADLSLILKKKTRDFF